MYCVKTAHFLIKFIYLYAHNLFKKIIIILVIIKKKQITIPESIFK